MLEYFLPATLLTEHKLEFLSLNGGCTGSSESTFVKMINVGNHMSWLNFTVIQLFYTFISNKSLKCRVMWHFIRVFTVC